ADNSAALLFRYNPDGSVDKTFADPQSGSVGYVSLGVPNNVPPWYHINALALQPDGKIVLAGLYTDQGTTSTSTHPFIFRRLATGASDPSFVPSAIFGGALDADAADIGLTVDNRIVLAGGANVPSNELAITRFLNDIGRVPNGPFGLQGSASGPTTVQL